MLDSQINKNFNLLENLGGFLMHMKDRGQYLHNHSPLVALDNLANCLGNLHIGRRDSHIFEEHLREVKDVGLGRFTAKELADAQKIVKGVVIKLIEAHGHIPPCKLIPILELGRIFFIDPLARDD